MGPLRLTAVLVHPVQYYAPWFRHIAANRPEIDLTVLYATEPTPEQQGVGFSQAFSWDVPLTEGYRCQVLRPARPGDDVHSSRFRGVDVPEIGAALLSTWPAAVLLPGWYSITLRRALRACRRAGIPVLYRGDSNLDSAPAGWRRLAWRARTRWLLHRFDGHLATGTRSREYLRSFGVDPEWIFPSPHCVDNEFFAERAAAARPAERSGFTVLFAGKLEPVKRPLDLIRAMPRLGPEARLLVAGSGPLEGACRAEAEALGIRVSWAGFLNQTEIAKAYAEADVLALPSASETWGLVVNEAMATGLPCVVSDRVGCAPDLVVPGETGEVFPMGDVGALAAALGRVRDARARAGGPGDPGITAACRERVAAFSFDAATDGLAAGAHYAVSRRKVAPLAPAGPLETPRVLALCGGMVIVSGLERMTFEVLRVLREKGAAVHCILNFWENQRIVPLTADIGASWSTGRYWENLDRHTRSPLKLLRMAWDIALTSRGLLRDARRFRPTHVLAAEFMGVIRNAPALALLRLMGRPVILRVGVAPTPGRAYQKVWRWGVSPFVDRFVCNSDFTRAELLAHGIPERKVERIYNTVPTRGRPVSVGTEAGVIRHPGRILYVGQIIPAKGLDLLVAAAALLVARGLDVRLDVVGQIDGWEAPGAEGYRAGLVARAEQPDLHGRVRFLGWREDVPELMALAAVHCCPSRPEIREAFGVVTVEAKQAGIPSVVFRSGALPELVRHEVDGWICEETTAAALAEGLEYFLADEPRRARCGAAARDSLRRFDRETFSAAWSRLFLAEPQASPLAVGSTKGPRA